MAVALNRPRGDGDIVFFHFPCREALPLPPAATDSPLMYCGLSPGIIEIRSRSARAPEKEDARAAVDLRALLVSREYSLC